MSLNNWNDNRKTDDVRRNYYRQILLDLKKDSTFITGRIKGLNSNILGYQSYNEAFPKQENVRQLIEIQSKLNHRNAILTFKTNTIETLEATADIKLIPTEIRNKLINLKNNQEAINRVASGNNTAFLRNLLDATKLGYTEQIATTIAHQNNTLISELKVLDNWPQIALIVNSAVALKNLTEKEQKSRLENMLKQIDNLTTLINVALEE